MKKMTHVTVENEKPMIVMHQDSSTMHQLVSSREDLILTDSNSLEVVAYWLQHNIYMYKDHYQIYLFFII
jgi:hypothetical protein